MIWGLFYANLVAILFLWWAGSGHDGIKTAADALNAIGRVTALVRLLADLGEVPDARIGEQVVGVLEAPQLDRVRTRAARCDLERALQALGV